MTQTRQLRRYDIQPGAMDAFVEWFRGPLMEARVSHGFTAESAYVDALENTVTWVARFDGTEAEFLSAERIYEDSAERALAFETYPGTIQAKYSAIVRAISL